MANTGAAPESPVRAILQFRPAIESRELARTEVAAPQPRSRVVFVMPRCRHDNVRAVHKQARSLQQAGYELVLVVKESEVNEYLGMKVVCAVAPFESVLRPILNFPTLLRQLLKLRADVYFLCNPDAIPLAITLKLLRRRVIYDTWEDFSKRLQIRDDLPRWSLPTLAWLITRLERLLARTADGVIVTQAHQADFLGGRTLLQLNAPLIGGPIVERAQSIRFPHRNNGIRLIYAGSITEARGIFSMLELIAKLNQHQLCELDLLGEFNSEDLKESAENHSGWQFVNYYGEVSHAAALAQIKAADIGLAILEPVADYPTSSITKLFEYMQFGVPFIASDFPAWKVSTALGSPGLYVDPGSFDDIVAAGLRLTTDRILRERLGEAGKNYVATKFNWERISEPFLELVAGISGRKRGLEAEQH